MRVWGVSTMHGRLGEPLTAFKRKAELCVCCGGHLTCMPTSPGRVAAHAHERMLVHALHAWAACSGGHIRHIRHIRPPLPLGAQSPAACRLAWPAACCRPGEGSLLPLWKFVNERAKRRQVGAAGARGQPAWWGPGPPCHGTATAAAEYALGHGLMGRVYQTYRRDTHHHTSMTRTPLAHREGACTGHAGG